MKTKVFDVSHELQVECLTMCNSSSSSSSWLVQSFLDKYFDQKLENRFLGKKTKQCIIFLSSLITRAGGLPGNRWWERKVGKESKTFLGKSPKQCFPVGGLWFKVLNSVCTAHLAFKVCYSPFIGELLLFKMYIYRVIGHHFRTFSEKKFFNYFPYCRLHLLIFNLLLFGHLLAKQ